MKKFKFILVILLALLILPFGVLAEEDEEYTEEAATEEVASEETNSKVKLYFFRGEGCPHCAEAEEFFESIQEEYGQYFEIVDYETWYNEENAELLQKVGEVRDEEIGGVPYILIGNKSWAGYAADYDEDIKAAIVSEYEKEPADRYDIMDYVSGKKVEEKDESYASDVLVLLAIIVVVGGIVTGIVFARKKS